MPVSDNKQFQNTQTHTHVYNTTQRIIIRFRITHSSFLWEIIGLPVTNVKVSNQFFFLPCTHAATEIHCFSTFFRRSQFPSRCCDWHQAGYPSSQYIWSSDVSARTSGFPAASDGERRSEVQCGQWQRCYLGTVHTTARALLLRWTLAHHSRYFTRLGPDEFIILIPYLFRHHNYLIKDCKCAYTYQW